MAGAIYVTHYGQVRDIPRLAGDMHRLVAAHEELARVERGAGSTRHARLTAGVAAIVLAEAQRYAWRLNQERVLEVFAGDIELNAQGLALWADTLPPP